jgi:hypothetical protein
MEPSAVAGVLGVSDCAFWATRGCFQPSLVQEHIMTTKSVLVYEKRQLIDQYEFPLEGPDQDLSDEELVEEAKKLLKQDGKSDELIADVKFKIQSV